MQRPCHKSPISPKFWSHQSTTATVRSMHHKSCRVALLDVISLGAVFRKFFIRSKVINGVFMQETLRVAQSDDVIMMRDVARRDRCDAALQAAFRSDIRSLPAVAPLLEVLVTLNYHKLYTDVSKTNYHRPRGARFTFRFHHVPPNRGALNLHRLHVVRAFCCAIL